MYLDDVRGYLEGSDLSDDRRSGLEWYLSSMEEAVGLGFEEPDSKVAFESQARGLHRVLVSLGADAQDAR